MPSNFQRLPDDTYTEHDPDTGWRGTSRYQHGLVTGRPSPRIPQRVRPVTGLMRGHEDLRTETDIAGHGHGQFFDVAPYVKPKAEVLRAAGVPERRTSSGEGFLPRLGSVAGSTGAEREKILQTKVETLGQASRITRPVEHSGITHELGDPGTPHGLKTQMANRAGFVNPNIQGDWYVKESEQVNERATQTGVHHSVQRRATAIASPKTPWDRGHPQEGNVRYTNLDNAQAIVQHVQNERQRAANEGRGFSATEAALETRVPTVAGDSERMPAFTRVMRAIGEGMEPHASPADRIITATERTKKADLTGEKVPNFDLALERGSPSITGRREAAQAYTSDIWDIRSAGIKDYGHVGGGGLTKPKGTQRREGGDLGLVSNRPKGQYDVVAMTGRRSGFKAGMLPSEMQQHIWRSARGAGPQTEQQMFMPGVGHNSHTAEFISPALSERTGSRNRIVNSNRAEHEAWLDENDDF